MRTAKIKESLTRLRQSGLPVSQVLDVGVLHATPVLMEVYGDKTHHLFEPVDDYFPVIRKNYAAIDHRLVHAAVSDVDGGDVWLHSEKKMGNDEISHSWISAQPSATSRRVATITLDDHIAREGLKGPFLLKIDVDGAPVPASILRGAKACLADCSVVVIEMTVDRFFERAKLLEEAGFDIWDLTALCYYGDCLWQFDAVYVKKSFKKLLPTLTPMHQPPFDMKRWQQG